MAKVLQATNETVSHYKFPIIDGKSPSVFTFKNPTDEPVEITLIVEAYGGLPDPDYFGGDE